MSTARPGLIRSGGGDPADGEPPQYDGKQDEEDHAQPEIRHRVEHHRSRGDGVILPGVPPPGGDDPADGADDRREDRRDTDQGQRRRDGGDDLVPDRLPGLIGDTEVELGRLPEIERNWVPIGWSNPNATRRLSSVSWGTFRPRNKDPIGSVCTTRNRKKLNTSTKTRVMRAPKTLRPMSLPRPRPVVSSLWSETHSRSSAVERFRIARNTPPIRITPAAIPPQSSQLMPEPSSAAAPIGVSSHVARARCC